MSRDEHLREGEGIAVILYDGVCGLCNRGVRLVLKRDRKGVFRFASLQSSVGREILARHGITPDALDTFYVVRNFARTGECVLSRSSAAIYTASPAITEQLLQVRQQRIPPITQHEASGLAGRCARPHSTRTRVLRIWGKAARARSIRLNLRNQRRLGQGLRIPWRFRLSDRNRR